MENKVYFKVFCLKGRVKCEEIDAVEFERLQNLYCDLMSVHHLGDNFGGYRITVAGDWCDVLLVERKY